MKITCHTNIFFVRRHCGKKTKQKRTTFFAVLVLNWNATNAAALIQSDHFNSQGAVGSIKRQQRLRGPSQLKALKNITDSFLLI